MGDRHKYVLGMKIVNGPRPVTMFFCVNDNWTGSWSEVSKSGGCPICAARNRMINLRINIETQNEPYITAQMNHLSIS